MSSIGKKSNSGGGGKKTSSNQGSSAGKPSGSKSSSKGKKPKDERGTYEISVHPGDPGPATVQGRSGDPGPATVQGRAGSQGPSRLATPPRAGTPIPWAGTPRPDPLRGMSQTMRVLGDTEAWTQQDRQYAEEQDQLKRARAAGRSVEATGRIDDTNRTNKPRVPEDVQRKFAPIRDPNDLRDLSHFQAPPDIHPGPSTEQGHPFGNENFVLITEYLMSNSHEDPEELHADLCEFLEKCFGNASKRYSPRSVRDQLKELHKTRTLPPSQIKLPGEYTPRELGRLMKNLVGYRALAVGRRCQMIATIHFHGDADHRAFQDDGTVLEPRPQPPSLNVFRSIKYLDAFTTHYGYEHWPAELRGKIFHLFAQKEKDVRRYNDVEIWSQLDQDEREEYNITDANAIAAFLLYKVRTSISDPAVPKEEAEKRRKYYFSKGPTPIAGGYTSDLYL